MNIRTGLVPLVFFCMPFSLLAQGTSQASQSQPWVLPNDVAPADSGARTYHFSIDYNTAGPTGEIIQRQRVTGDYTRGLPNNEVEWRNVGVATVASPTAPFPEPEMRSFMEGFRYRNDLGGTMDPAFFKTFPPSAVLERNLVWDTGMFEAFGQGYFDKLKLNVPLHIGAKDQDIQMHQVGTFRNHDVVLEWIGRSRRNGQDCALIKYRAFFNPVNIEVGITLKARSDYWGELWVSLATKQIEYATLCEEVIGQIKLPGQTVMQPLNVFRVGSFEPMLAGETGR